LKVVNWAVILNQEVILLFSGLKKHIFKENLYIEKFLKEFNISNTHQDLINIINRNHKNKSLLEKILIYDEDLSYENYPSKDVASIIVFQEFSN